MTRALGAVVALAGVVRAQGPSPVAAVGKGVLRGFSPATGESLDLELRLGNSSNLPVAVTRAEVLMACQGGWSIVTRGDMIAREGKFFGGDPVLGAGGRWFYRYHYEYSFPITHYLLALQLGLPGRPPRDHLLQVPFVRPGFSSPLQLRAAAPVFIGLQEPVEALELATGEVWLPVIGQIINVSGKPLHLRGWRFQLEGLAGNGELDRDLTQRFRLHGSTRTLNEFFFGFSLPHSFRTGTLRIDADLELQGQRRPVISQAAVERVAGTLVAPPVEGAWIWNNGPGERVFHTHFHFPEHRYAYDFVIARQGQGQRRTFSGDPGRNESFFNWNQPIHCVQDGKVAAVIDDVPDNFGLRTNPANHPVRNSCIVVEHPGPCFSLYVHVRQASAIVKVGQRVKAGQVLGRIGNAGLSSEPHLHFAYQVLDRTGRTRTVPVRIRGLESPDGRPAAGIPKGGLKYVSSAAR